MDLKTQKRMAAKILKVGLDRVKIKESKDVEDALTREDIRKLIRRGIIEKKEKKGTNRYYARKTLIQKSKGRRKGVGSRKGKAGARYKKKERWIKQVRALRRLLKELKEKKQIDERYYQKLYLMIKGNMFRNKKHLLYYLQEKGMLRKAKTNKD